MSGRTQALAEAKAACERQLDLVKLAVILNPDDFEKGVLTCMAAIQALIDETR